MCGSARRSVEPVSAPTAAPMNSVGVNTPPTAPDPTVEAVLATLAKSTARSIQPSSRLVQDRIHDAVAVAPDLRKGDGNQTDDQTAQRELQIQGAGKRREPPLAPRQQGQKRRRQMPEQHAEHRRRE